MTRAARHFEGKYDFRNFCRIDEHVTNFIRAMYDVHTRRRCDDFVGDSDQPLLDENDDEYTTHYVMFAVRRFFGIMRDVQVPCYSISGWDVRMWKFCAKC